MTKDNLLFMFNHSINGFFIKHDVMINQMKKGGKKFYRVTDMRAGDEIKDFETIDQLFNYEIDGVKINDILAPLDKLKIEND